MKEFLLNKKYLGLFSVLIYVLIVSVYATNITKEMLHAATPFIAEEADYFLPIAFEGGRVVTPENKVISRSYGANNRVFNVVLDTRFDEMPNTMLEHEGIYLSRKYLYAVSDKKTEIRKMDDIPDIYIDAENFSAGLKLMEEKADKYLFFGVLGVMLIFVSVAILLYSLVIHLLMTLLYNTEFTKTLRITTLAYVAISVLELILPFSIGIITMFLILALINVAVNSLEHQPYELKKEDLAPVETEIKKADETPKPTRKRTTSSKTAKKTATKKSVKKKSE